MSSNLHRTTRTQIKRIPERANYEIKKIYEVIDQAYFGTIAFFDFTNVHGIPTAIWREGQHVYIHGSNGSRLIKFLKTGAEVCVSITNVHGLVLARSALKHSMNYSSVCIYGSFKSVLENKKNHMQYFMEHWLPGRWEYVRAPDQKELDALTIMRIEIIEAVLKSREGQPLDYEEDLQQNVWAGIIPLQLQRQKPKQVSDQTNYHLPGNPGE